MRNRHVLHGTILLACVSIWGCAPQIVASEPPPGALRPGQSVLVDDGKCPAGQIAEIVGGANIASGSTTNTIGQSGRTHNCVPRPKS